MITIPRFIKMELIVEFCLLQVGEQMDSPAQSRRFSQSISIRTGKFAERFMIVVKCESDSLHRISGLIVAPVPTARLGIL